MSIASAIAAGRVLAESRMASAGTAYRRNGYTTDANRLQVPAWEVVYTGKCRIAGGRGPTSSTPETTADLDIARSSMVGHFPHATELRDGDLIEVNAGESAGLVFRVVEADQGDQRTACRVRLIQTERPAEWEAA
jgi:hypothetical protein